MFLKTYTRSRGLLRIHVNVFGYTLSLPPVANDTSEPATVSNVQTAHSRALLTQHTRVSAFPAHRHSGRPYRECTVPGNFHSKRGSWDMVT